MSAVDSTVKNLLRVLMDFPFLKDHYLAGGTNLALRYHHRTSIDLDFFVYQEMDVAYSNALNLALKNALGNRFESIAVTKTGVFGYVDAIKVDFVNYPYPLLHEIDRVDLARLAHPLDIGGMKINAIVGRGSRKDFFDLHYLLNSYSLQAILDNYKKKYGLDTIDHAKTSLVYFNDAEDKQLRDNQFISFTNTSWEEIKINLAKALKEFESHRIVSEAVKFHYENEYPQKQLKKAASSPNSPLYKAFKEAYGITLTKKQLKEIDSVIKS